MWDMKRILFAVVGFMAGVSSDLCAQTTTKVLTFEDAIKIALENSVLLNHVQIQKQLPETFYPSYMD